MLKSPRKTYIPRKFQGTPGLGFLAGVPEAKRILFAFYSPEKIVLLAAVLVKPAERLFLSWKALEKKRVMTV
jgi:hypothetical protein